VAKYSANFKQAIVKKLAESALSDRQFAIQEGLAVTTLHSWKVKYQIERVDQRGIVNPESWSPEEKFAIVLEVASFSETELGEYCRAKGLYPEQVKLWKQFCIQGNMTNNEHKRLAAVEAKADKKRIKELERELNRKEKALAETAALLVLRKKLNALWEESEED